MISEDPSAERSGQLRLLLRWLAERGGVIAILLLVAVIAFLLWQQRR